MKINNKVMLVLLVIIIVLILALLTINIVKKINQNNTVGTNNNSTTNNTASNAGKLSKGTKQNIDSNMSVEKSFEGVTISSAEVYSNNGKFTFFVNIKNTSKDERNTQKIVINILDKEGKNIVTLDSNIPKLKAEQKITIACYTNVDITKAYDYNFEVKK